MYSPAFPCIPLYSPVFPRIPLYSPVFPCISLYFPCIPLYSYVFPCVTSQMFHMKVETEKRNEVKRVTWIRRITHFPVLLIDLSSRNFESHRSEGLVYTIITVHEVPTGQNVKHRCPHEPLCQNPKEGSGRCVFRVSKSQLHNACKESCKQSVKTGEWLHLIH